MCLEQARRHGMKCQYPEWAGKGNRVGVHTILEVAVIFLASHGIDEMWWRGRGNCGVLWWRLRGGVCEVVEVAVSPLCGMRSRWDKIVEG